MSDAPFRFVRVELAYMSKEAPLRPSEENVLVDAVLNEQERVAGGWDMYGRWKEDDGSGLKDYPMIIRADGEVFFGPDESYSSNIRDRTIKDGELCTFWGGDDRLDSPEWTYKITRVIDLTKGAK